MNTIAAAARRGVLGGRENFEFGRRPGLPSPFSFVSEAKRVFKREVTFHIRNHSRKEYEERKQTKLNRQLNSNRCEERRNELQSITSIEKNRANLIVNIYSKKIIKEERRSITIL
jgi:hypothetical protein